MDKGKLHQIIAKVLDREIEGCADFRSGSVVFDDVTFKELCQVRKEWGKPNKDQLKYLLHSQIDKMVDAMEEVAPGFDLCDVRLVYSEGNDDDGIVQYIVRADNYITYGGYFYTEVMEVLKVMNYDDETTECIKILEDNGVK